MIKNVMSAAVVALLSSQQAEARDFTSIKNELTEALNNMMSAPKKAAIDAVSILAAAPTDDDEADHVIDLDNDIPARQNGAFVYS